jgi:O-antigen ligase
MVKTHQLDFLKFAALGFILILPFLFNIANAISPFELFKISAATFYLIPAFFWLLLRLFEKDKILFRWNTGLVLTAFVVLSNLLSYAVSINPYLSFWGDNQLPSESLRSVLLFFTYCILVSQIAKDEVDIKIFMKALYAVATISILYGLVQICNLDPAWFSVYRTVIGTIGNTGAFASFLGALSPVMLAVFFTSNKRFVRYVTVVLVILLNFCILQTSSRVPLAVNLVITIFFIIFSFERKNYKKSFKKVAAALAVVLATGLFFKYITSATDAIENKMKPNYVSKALVIRKLLIANGYEAWKKQPIFGYGPETFKIAQRPLQSTEMNKYQAWEFGWQKAHNHLIQTLVCTGLFGLFFRLLLFGVLTFKFLRLFLKPDRDERDFYAASFYLGYLFLFTVNLAAFDFIPTQLYTSVFPILFFISLGQVKIFEFSMHRRLRSLLLILSGLPLLYFLTASYNYWSADVDYQKGRNYFEDKKNGLEAIKYTQRAIEQNDNEPLYYCEKAIIIGHLLNKNKNSISESVKRPILSEIDDNLNTCIQLSINRDEFLLMKGNVYGQLYFDGIISDPYKSLESYEQLSLLTPVSPRPHLQKGIIYERQGFYEKFREQMALAIQYKNDFVPAYIELINYYYKSKDFESVHRLAAIMNQIVFYASEQTEYLNDLLIIAGQNNDAEGEKMFRQLADRYKDFKDIN